MPSIVKPRRHHPEPAAQRARADHSRLRRRHVHAVRRLRARFHHRRDHARVLGAVDAAAHDRQAERHRLLVEDADVFRRRRARLQLRARPHAADRDRRQRRQSRTDLHRHLRRRRFAVDRPRPHVPRHPPQCADGLRHREQRRVRSDQGPVLRLGRRRLEEQARRGEPSAPIDPVMLGLSARRDLRRAQFLRRQGTAGADPQGRPGASRLRADRRHLALRDLQRSRGFDQELPVHAPARRADDRDRLRSARGGDLRDHPRPRAWSASRCTTARRCASAACPTATTRRTGWR